MVSVCVGKSVACSVHLHTHTHLTHITAERTSTLHDDEKKRLAVEVGDVGRERRGRGAATARSAHVNRRQIVHLCVSKGHTRHKPKTSRPRTHDKRTHVTQPPTTMR